MKTLLLLILLPTVLFSQGKFAYKEDGLTDFVVVDIENMTSDMLYKRTLDWIGETYKNRDKVVQFKIEGEKIKIEGITSNGVSSRILGSTTKHDVKYKINISFKDGKYKFDPIELKDYNKGSQYVSSGWYLINLSTNSWLYKKNGKPRKVKGSYLTEVPDVFNNLNLLLQNYLLKKSGAIEDKDNNW